MKVLLFIALFVFVAFATSDDTECDERITQLISQKATAEAEYIKKAQKLQRDNKQLKEKLEKAEKHLKSFQEDIQKRNEKIKKLEEQIEENAGKLAAIESGNMNEFYEVRIKKLTQIVEQQRRDIKDLLAQAAHN